MIANRFFWLLGVCALAMFILVGPVGCAPQESTDAAGNAVDDATDDDAHDDHAHDDDAHDDHAHDDDAHDDHAHDDDAHDDDAADEGPADDDAAQAAFSLEVPLGLSPPPIPEDNPMTAEKVTLGKMLYFDKRLSKDGTVSCATCHDPTKGWTDQAPTSTGIDGLVGPVNAPTVINSAYAKSQFWDGRAATLEEQALGPIQAGIEMGHTLDALIPELNEIAGYQEQFQAVFGTDVTADGIAKAIAAFERTVLSGDSPYDKFKAGDESALTEAQKRGLQVFESVGCDSCHKPPLFSNYMFVNAGIGSDKPEPDEGKEEGKFRVPALRDVANTFPYFHDGSAATLEEAVKLMAEGGRPNDNLSSILKQVGEEGIDEAKQKDIVEFLKALTGNPPTTEAPELP